MVRAAEGEVLGARAAHGAVREFRRGVREDGVPPVEEAGGVAGGRDGVVAGAVAGGDCWLKFGEEREGGGGRGVEERVGVSVSGGYDMRGGENGGEEVGHSLRHTNGRVVRGRGDSPCCIPVMEHPFGRLGRKDRMCIVRVHGVS